MRRRKSGGDRAALAVELGPLSLKSPIVTASGTFGLGDEYLEGIDTSKVGAFTTKSLSVFPWRGNPPPRIARTPAGMLNSIGLQNPGVDEWLKTHLPSLERTGVAVIGSVWGRNPAEFAEAADRLAAQECVVAVEINLSCPNIDEAGEIVAHSEEASGAVTAAVARAVGSHGKPVFAKLSPNLPSLTSLARRVIESGATGLTLTNTLLGMAIDTARGAPLLGKTTGGLSGPAIKPVVLRHVFEVASAMQGVPIIATGGVFNGCDAAEMLMAGAGAVGVGTASFYDPRAPQVIAEELQVWSRRSEVGRVADLTGVALRGGLP